MQVDDALRATVEPELYSQNATSSRSVSAGGSSSDDSSSSTSSDFGARTFSAQAASTIASRAPLSSTK